MELKRHFKTSNVFSAVIAGLCIAYLIGWHVSNLGLNPFTWDTFGYYLYLPMSIIYNDLGITDFSIITDLQERQFVSNTLYQINKLETGGWLIRYPCGLSILLLPFFLLGHLAAIFLNYPVDGFSEAYQVAIVFGCLFYVSLGVVVLRKILLRWFSDVVTAVVIGVLFLGTNFVNEATFGVAMPHGLLFFLYTLIILLTAKWHERATILNSLGLGLVIGLAAISRPTESISVLIPVFWGVARISDFPKKVINVLGNSFAMVLLAVAAGAAVVLIQLTYWKVYGGAFFIDSYNNPGEGLDFLTPHTLKVLFGFRKGWFIYTPMAMFFVAGFVFIRKNEPQVFWSFFTYFILNLYLVSSWTCWWYAESFSQRALVQSYAVLTVAFGFLFSDALKWQLRNKIILCTGLALVIGLNLFQLHQFRLGIIHESRMTKAYYMKVFGKLNVDKKSLQSLLLLDRNSSFEEAIEIHEYSSTTLLQDDYETETDTVRYTMSAGMNGSKAIALKEGQQFSVDLKIPYDHITKTDYVWIKTTVWAYFTEMDAEVTLVNSMYRNGDMYKYRSTNILSGEQNPKPGKWMKLSTSYLTPHLRSRKDQFQMYFWKKKGSPVYLDNLEVEVYKPIN